MFDLFTNYLAKDYAKTTAIVHLVRDPRAILASRIEFHKLEPPPGIFSDLNPKHLCDSIRMDFKNARQFRGHFQQR